MRLPRWLNTRSPTLGLEVDYSQEVGLPRDAEKVLWHKPAGVGKTLLLPEHLIVRPMPRGVSYLDYKNSLPEVVFGDALILDSLLAPYLRGDASRIREVEKLLRDFSGQVFFLGTAFEARFEGTSTLCFAYLNWKTYQPALRYMCPGHHPINHSVNCCALHIEVPVALAS